MKRSQSSVAKCRVVHVITGLGNGGAEAVLYRLVMSDSVFEHRVISLTDAGKYGSLLESAGVPVVCLGMPRGRVTLRGLWRLWQTLRREKPDIVQTWMYHADLLGGFVARFAGIRRVFWGIHHTTLDPQASSRSAIIVAKVCARLSRWIPERIVCCAEESRLVHAALGYRESKMVVISNGYDLGQFRMDTAARARMRAELGVADNMPLLGTVARFDAQKDHKNLLDALARLVGSAGREVRCALIGTGLTTDNAQLIAWITERGLEGKMLLLGSRNDVPALMNALDVHALSSAFGEAFPNVLAEAMACGTPCVTTNVGDAARIVGDTGWVVPARNSGELADALEMALRARAQEPHAWLDRQRACRARIEANFSIEAMVQRYHKAWGLQARAPSAPVATEVRP